MILTEATMSIDDRMPKGWTFSNLANFTFFTFFSLFCFSSPCHLILLLDFSSFHFTTVRLFDDKKVDGLGFISDAVPAVLLSNDLLC